MKIENETRPKKFGIEMKGGNMQLARSRLGGDAAGSWDLSFDLHPNEAATTLFAREPSDISRRGSRQREAAQRHRGGTQRDV